MIRNNIDTSYQTPAATKSLLSTDYTFQFKLLLALLVFNSFRPDKLIPGGSILQYLPTLLLLILFVKWIGEKHKMLSNPQTKLFFAMIILLAISVILARNKSWAFTQYKSIVIYIFVPYILMVQFIDTSFKADKYIRLFLLLGIFFGVLGIVGKAKIVVPQFSDENDFALYANILIPFSFFLAQEASSLKSKIIYYSTIVIFVIVDVKSFSRGALVGLLSVGLFLFLKSRRKLVIFCISILLLICIMAVATPEYWAKMDTISLQSTQDQTGTARERLESWKAGWHMFLDNPVFGIGPRNFGIWFPEYYVEYGDKHAHNMWGRVAHSLYFTLLSENGLTGTIIFFLMVWHNYRSHRFISTLNVRKNDLAESCNVDNLSREDVRRAIRNLYYLSLSCCGGLIAYLITGAFISVLWYGYFWILTSFFVIIENSARKIKIALAEHSAMGNDLAATSSVLSNSQNIRSNRFETSLIVK